MLVKLAQDDPHIIALWTEGQVRKGEWMMAHPRVLEAVGRECSCTRGSKPRALPEQGRQGDLRFSGPLWGPLSLGSCCQPSPVSWANSRINLHRLEANADSSKGPWPLRCSPPTLQGAQTV